MTLPPWDCITVEDQEAFAEFILSELHEMDVAEAIISELLEMDVAEANSMPSGLPIEWINEVSKRQEIEQLAREHGLEIQPPPRQRGRPRKPNKGTPLECAVRDVDRMRDIFRQYWNKANRHSRPTREDIAADYWELSVADRQTLRTHLTKTAKP